MPLLLETAAACQPTCSCCAQPHRGPAPASQPCSQVVGRHVVLAGHRANQHRLQTRRCRARRQHPEYSSRGLHLRPAPAPAHSFPEIRTFLWTDDVWCYRGIASPAARGRTYSADSSDSARMRTCRISSLIMSLIRALSFSCGTNPVRPE